MHPASSRDSLADPDPAAQADGLAAVRARIDAAARASGRDPSDIGLVAVSKQQPWARVAPILAAGQDVFGENRVQEAAARWTDVRAGRPGLELRMIGPLQTNKAADAVRLFDVIETLDRPKLAWALAQAAQTLGFAPRLYVQVNIGTELQKAGIAPEAAGDFIATIRRDYGLVVEGLMCIPPVDQPPEPYFSRLAQIAAHNGLAEISMGMSGDFEAAIRCGATSVRIGSAIFGDRLASPGPAAGSTL